jgi:hypothetical protein
VLEHPQDREQVQVVMVDTAEEPEAMAATMIWNSRGQITCPKIDIFFVYIKKIHLAGKQEL